MFGEKSYMFLRNCFCLREPLDDIAIAPSAQLLDDITSVAIGTAVSVVRATDSLYRNNNRPISSIYISEASSTAKTQEKKKRLNNIKIVFYISFPTSQNRRHALLEQNINSPNLQM